MFLDDDGGKAENIGLAGKLHPVNLSLELKEVFEEVFRGEEVGSVSKVLRVVDSNGQVFFSKDYSRMKKRVCFYSLINDGPNGTFIGEVQHFLYIHRTMKCYAVYKKVNLPKTNPQLHKQVSHIFKVGSIEENIGIVLANQLTEKLMSLNDAITQVPNLHGLCH